MRRTQECIERLLTELTDEQRQLLQRADLLEEAVRSLDDLAQRICSGEGARGAVPGSLAEVRERVHRLRRELTDAWSLRLRRWTHMAEGLSKELSRVGSLTTLGELSASVAHEIRNPLCGILLSVEVLQTKMDPEDSRSAVLHNLHREAEKMEKVVNNLFHFARHYQPRLMPCDLAEVVMNGIESVRSHLTTSRTEVNVRRSTADCLAEVDPNLVQQVFSNLLLNSVAACPKGSKLDIELRAADEPARIAVAFRDEGEGIRSDLLARIFDPFFTSKANGIGLGLSVSKKIVEAHSGRIEVTSQLGKGTTFTVIFPREAGQQRARVAA